MNIWDNAPKAATHHLDGQYLKVEEIRTHGEYVMDYHIRLAGRWEKIYLSLDDIAEAMERPVIPKPSDATHRLKGAYFKLKPSIAWTWLCDEWTEIKLTARQIEKLRPM